MLHRTKYRVAKFGKRRPLKSQVSPQVLLAFRRLRQFLWLFFRKHRAGSVFVHRKGAVAFSIGNILSACSVTKVIETGIYGVTVIVENFLPSGGGPTNASMTIWWTYSTRETSLTLTLKRG